MFGAMFGYIVCGPNRADRRFKEYTVGFARAWVRGAPDGVKEL
jgi:hypothetical protein